MYRMKACQIISGSIFSMGTSEGYRGSARPLPIHPIRGMRTSQAMAPPAIMTPAMRGPRINPIPRREGVTSSPTEALGMPGTDHRGARCQRPRPVMSIS